MKRSSYYERDYTFGQAMLVLRTTIGLTQAGIAEKLRVSRKAVGEWEAGINYPKAEHLKAFIVLAAENQAFAAGREGEEIRAFWQTAHQKVLLDEVWLAALLHRIEGSQVSQISQPNVESVGAAHTLTSPTRGSPLVDWGDAPTVTSFYGRLWELNLLTEWIAEEHCRVVSVLGLGGIGKTALATKAMHQVAENFEVVIWRSLRNVPTCETLLDDCLQVLAPVALRDVSTSLESRQGLLLECLRRRRILLVYDNLESFLGEGQNTGHVRSGYEGFAQVLRLIAETRHQSCLLLTSREKPVDLVPLEGSRSPVRTLRLARLDVKACEQLLAEKEVTGSAADYVRLIEAYASNPLALKIVAQTIVDLFDGEIAPLLAQGEMVFGGVRELLDEQYARLANLERTLLCWLAIVREPTSFNELRALLVAPWPAGELLEAVNGLLRRSLIERGQHPGNFTLQSVVLEYVTTRLVTEVSGEIVQGRPDHLIQQGLSLAQVRDYVRQTQERLLLVPLLTRLRSTNQEDADVEALLLSLLDQLRGRPKEAQGYGPANLVALLRLLRGDLRGLDLSQLALRGVFLQGVEMQDATLSGALMHECVFSEAFDATWAVVISRNGTSWAASSRRGEVRVWRQEGKILHLSWQAHSDTVRTLAFSPDGATLATGSWEGATELWDLEHGVLLWRSWHPTGILSLAFAPDGGTLASGGDDAVVQLWDAHNGMSREKLSGPSGPVHALAWSPDGRLLASGSFDGGIRLWQLSGVQPETCVPMLTGHTNWVTGLAFAPDGRTLASGSFDRTVKLWEVASGRCLQTLTNTDPVFAVAWSPDGRLLASSGFDQTIWLWDIEQASYRTALHGHTAAVYDLAFTPDSRYLLSGSDDRTLRVWEVERGQCIHIMKGYAVLLYDVAWSPAGTRLASAGSDTLVTLWDVEGLTPPRLLHGHRWIVHGVAWSPDGRFLASCGEDNAVLVWDATTREARQHLQDPDRVDTCFYGVAWSPNGQWLACASYQQGVQVWEVTTGTRRWVGRAQSTRIRRVVWSPDGTRLASGGDDGSVCLWQASDGQLRARLDGHRGMVMSLAWSPDGTRLASGGGDRGNGELVVWDVHGGERLYSWSEPSAIVDAVAWSPTGAVLISGGSDGTLRWWDVQSGKCLHMQQAHQGTVQALKVSPDGSRLASCGDDGAIMLWDLHSGEPLQTLRRDRPYERLDITRISGLTEAQKGTLRALGAIEDAP